MPPPPPSSSSSSLLLPLFVVSCLVVVSHALESATSSSFATLAWEPACSDSEYDFTGTLHFCQDANNANVYGYRLSVSDPCGALAPMLRMTAGNAYQLALVNDLDPAVDTTTTTNLHTHGLHISGDGNADDVTRMVAPGMVLLYNYTIPESHMEGTFWYHAHEHGKTERQVQGGAMGLLVIDPSESALQSDANRPDWVDRERHLLFSANRIGDARVNGLGVGQQETVQLVRNQWTHLRVAVGDTRANARNLVFDARRCTVHAAAYDGVWRTNVVPNPVDQYVFRVAGANRMDFAIKCKFSSGLYYEADSIDDIPTSPLLSQSGMEPIVKFTVRGLSLPRALPSWEPERPEYLRDLSDDDMADTWTVNLASNRINGQSWDPDVAVAKFAYGSTQQWLIQQSEAHPFHLHLYHMQVVTPGGCGGIYEQGEWFDTLAAESDCRVRFRLVDLGGRVVLHCHHLQHEDRGMMVWVDVTDAPQASNLHLDAVSEWDEDACDGGRRHLSTSSQAGVDTTPRRFLLRGSEA